MTAKVSYRLPPEKHKVAEVVSSVPDSWCCVSASLFATEEMYSQGNVSKNTRIYISRFHSIKPLIVEACDLSYEKIVFGARPPHRKEVVSVRDLNDVTPKIVDVIVRKKHPSSIRLEHAGYNGDEIKFKGVRELLRELILQGYMGGVSADSGHYDDSMFENPERLEISHKDKSIELEWSRSYGGNRAGIRQIEETLKTIGAEKISEDVPEEDAEKASEPLEA